MKTIIRATIILWATLSLFACQKEFNREADPLIIFDTKDYPIVEGYMVVDEPVNGQKLILSYLNGQSKMVEVKLEPQSGIEADIFTATLESGAGTIEIPLKGTPKQTGIATLKARITYERYTIFCSRNIGIRPSEMPDVELTVSSKISGPLYRDIASACTYSMSYINGWGRKIEVWFTCEDSGLSQQPEIFTLALDDQSGALVIPFKGTPEQAGDINPVLHIQLDGETEQTFNLDKVTVREAVPFIEQTVTHTIIVTDRNVLMTTPEAIQYQEFTYKTVFLDLNGDGYVTDNAEIWLDRNVGATSTDPESADSYGFYYQPGRDAPGWYPSQKVGGLNGRYFGERYGRNNLSWYNGATVTPPAIDEYDPVTNKKVGTITVAMGKIGPNNPCPTGYRMPRSAEFQRVYNYYNGSADEFKNGVLKLPFAGGYQSNDDISKYKPTGTVGCYWGAPDNNGNVSALFLQDKANPLALRQAGFGLSIRCVKALDSETATYN